MNKIPQSFPRNAPCPCGSGKKFKLCCRSTDISPANDSRVSINIARQLLKSGHPGLADEVCRRLIDEGKSVFEALCLRGDISSNLNDSISYYLLAADMNPLDAGVNYKLGKLYMAARQFGDAIKAYEKCLEISHGDEVYQVALGVALSASL